MRSTTDRVVLVRALAGDCLRSKRSRTSRKKLQGLEKEFRLQDAPKMGREQKRRGKWGELFLLSPHFPRFLNAILLLAALLFRSARTRMLATQARPGTM